MTERQADDGARITGYRFHLSGDMTLRAAHRDFPGLVFAGLQRQALLQPLREPLVAVSATYDSAPVGLALAELLPDGSAALRSLVVHPAHRRRGVATALVVQIERILRRAGRSALEVVYRLNWAGAPAIERLLARRAWLPPQPRMLHYRTDAAHMVAAPWPPAPRHAPATIVLWADLSAIERAAIHERQARAAWYPETLSPFQLEPRMEPRTSVGLRHAGRIGGWLITHRLLPDTLQYTCLFVEPRFQRFGGALGLIRAVAERQLAAGIPNTIFQVQAANTAMVRFVDTRLLPYLTARTESRVALLQLADH